MPEGHLLHLVAEVAQIAFALLEQLLEPGLLRLQLLHLGPEALHLRCLEDGVPLAGLDGVAGPAGPARLCEGGEAGEEIAAGGVGCLGELLQLLLEGLKLCVLGLGLGGEELVLALELSCFLARVVEAVLELVDLGAQLGLLLLE